MPGTTPGGTGGMPDLHASTHKHGGSDEISTSTPGINEIVKAGADGKIADGWLSSAIARIVDLTWGSITGKPSAFPPASHNHDWGDVDGKPSTFPPAPHTHPAVDLPEIRVPNQFAFGGNIVGQNVLLAGGRTHLPAARAALYHLTSNSISGGCVPLPSNPAEVKIGDIVLVRVTADLQHPVSIRYFAHGTNSGGALDTGIQSKGTVTQYRATAYASELVVTWTKITTSSHLHPLGDVAVTTSDIFGGEQLERIPLIRDSFFYISTEEGPWEASVLDLVPPTEHNDGSGGLFVPLTTAEFSGSGAILYLPPAITPYGTPWGRVTVLFDKSAGDGGVLTELTFRDGGTDDDVLHIPGPGVFPEYFQVHFEPIFDEGEWKWQSYYHASPAGRALLAAPDAPTQRGLLGVSNLPAKVDAFTSSGTWTKAAGAKMVHILLIGGGGGGGAGRRGAASTFRGAGAGGAGGGFVSMWIPESVLAGSVSVTIGAGGAAGTAASNNSNGGAGGNGGNTIFGAWTAVGGGGGEGGTNTVSAAGGAGTASRSLFYGTAEALAAGGTGGWNSTPSTAGADRNFSPTGGGGGSRLSDAGSINNGGAGGSIGVSSATGLTAGGAYNSGASGAAGGSGNTGPNYAGTGGGGSRTANALNAFAGGNGGLYGGGGGGSGATENDASGTNPGGAGAQGIAVITTYF